MGNAFFAVLLILMSGGMTAFGLMVAKKDNFQRLMAILFFGWPMPLIIYGFIVGAKWMDLKENPEPDQPVIYTEDSYDNALRERMQEEERSYW